MTGSTHQEILQAVGAVKTIAGAREQIRKKNESMRTKLVVLDDDPTGCQTVHDVQVLTSWESEILKKAVEENDFFFVLTNSRAYSEDKAIDINREIVQRLLEYADRNSLRIVSRSDSTLRGHFAAETRLLMEKLGPFDGVLIAPYFKEGGRLTVNDTHYVQQQDRLIEAAKTEFAGDPVFGFRHSHLPAWVEAKSRGFWRKEDAVSITLDDIRRGGPEKVYQKFKAVENSKPIVVNALCDEDIEVVCLGLCRAESEGKRFLYRTAASFVKIRAGVGDTELYVPEETNGKGLVVVGSYVERTTRQLSHLLADAHLQQIEVRIDRVLADEQGDYLDELVKETDSSHARKRPVAIFTERKYVLAGCDKDRLDAGMRISDFLCALVAQLKEEPAFIIAKGGITSYDVAKKGLNVKEATVLGQILPGIPIWKIGAESKYPRLPYVVFPGNVGTDESLLDAYLRFSHA
ncbi:MAG: hypothetical protein JSU70_15885 [Phycisphaerales bacterium]|nr:MAG: hypothetical protein JSU70_15885 [Phycisphaerales bacterium]